MEFLLRDNQKEKIMYNRESWDAKKDFLDNRYNNYQHNNIYDKPFFQKYINTVNRGKGIKHFQSGYDFSSFDFKYFSNDIKDMSQNINRSNTRNDFISKNIHSSKKIFKKKTVGNSFSIHYKNDNKIDINNSKENNFKINNIKNKAKAEKELKDSMEEKGIIKVHRQININKKRKGYSLSDFALDNKYSNNIKELVKNKDYKKNLNKIEKSKRKKNEV